MREGEGVVPKANKNEQREGGGQAYKYVRCPKKINMVLYYFSMTFFYSRLTLINSFSFFIVENKVSSIIYTNQTQIILNLGRGC